MLAPWLKKSNEFLSFESKTDIIFKEPEHSCISDNFNFNCTPKLKPVKAARINVGSSGTASASKVKLHNPFIKKAPSSMIKKGTTLTSPCVTIFQGTSSKVTPTTKKATKTETTPLFGLFLTPSQHKLQHHALLKGNDSTGSDGGRGANCNFVLHHTHLIPHELCGELMGDRNGGSRMRKMINQTGGKATMQILPLKDGEITRKVLIRGESKYADNLKDSLIKFIDEMNVDTPRTQASAKTCSRVAFSDKCRGVFLRKLYDNKRCEWYFRCPSCGKYEGKVARN
jgi:hypothetical protein